LEQERPIADPVAWIKQVSVADAAAHLVKAMNYVAKDDTKRMAFAEALSTRVVNDPTDEWKRIMATFANCDDALVGASSDASDAEIEAGQQALLKALEDRSDDTQTEAGKDPSLA
jgi:hypothetical protein